MVIKYYVYATAEVTENLVVRIYEAQAPEAVVYSETLSAPHTSGHLVIANGLDFVVHIVRLYGATSNAMIHQYNVEPTSETAVIFDPIFFKIGDGAALTPAAGSKAYTNPVLEGLLYSDYKITRNNYGILFHGSHYTVNTAAGSFTLMGDDQFNEGEEFVIERKPVISKTVGNDSVVGKWFAGFVDIASNTNYDPAHLRKLLRFSGTCTYDLTGAIPVGYAFCFQHYGTPGTGTVKFTNAPLRWGNSTKASIQIPSETEACFVFDGTAWNVVYISDAATVQNNTPAAGTILGADTYLLNNQGSGYPNGDVTPGDPQWLVTHNLNISGDYMVLLTLKSNNNSTYHLDNKVAAPVFQHHPSNKANAFLFTLQEIDNAQQNLSVCWVAIKL